MDSPSISPTTSDYISTPNCTPTDNPSILSPNKIPTSEPSILPSGSLSDISSDPAADPSNHPSDTLTPRPSVSVISEGTHHPSKQ